MIYRFKQEKHTALFPIRQLDFNNKNVIILYNEVEADNYEKASF